MTTVKGKGPISISSHLFCSHHTNWLALEEVRDELGNEGAVDKTEVTNQAYSLFGTELPKNNIKAPLPPIQK